MSVDIPCSRKEQKSLEAVARRRGAMFWTTWGRAHVMVLVPTPYQIMLPHIRKLQLPRRVSVYWSCENRSLLEWEPDDNLSLDLLLSA
jgi:hypothetical protein